MSKQVFILGGARTPMTQHVGALKDFSAIDLGAIASKAALERTGTKPEWIDHVVFGNVQQSSVDAHYGARHVGLKAGVPQEVPALTVNRLCGSGIQAVINGAQHIQLDEAGFVLAGGMENMSQVPHIIRGLRGGLKLGQGKLEDWLWEGLNDPYAGCSMAITAENCAVKYGITREDADAYALRSQQLAHKAWTSGIMKDEVVPVEIKTKKGVTLVEKDDHMRSATTMELLAKLPAAFKKDGGHAGNASGIVDGGRACDRRKMRVKARRSPIGRIRSWATVGVEPAADGHGPGAGDPQGPRACRNEARRSRLDRDQRGVRAAVSRVREGIGSRSRQGQRQRRRDCARPSARRQRGAPAADPVVGIAASWQEVWSGVRLHRRGSGHCHDYRGGLKRYGEAGL